MWPRAVQSVASCRDLAAARGDVVAAHLEFAPANAAANASAYRSWMSRRPAHFASDSREADAVRALGMPSAEWSAVLRDLSIACADLGVTMPTTHWCGVEIMFPWPLVLLALVGDLIFLFLPQLSSVAGVNGPGPLFGLFFAGGLVMLGANDPLRRSNLKSRNRNAAAAIELSAMLCDSSTAAGGVLAAAGLTARVVEVDLGACCTASCQRACDRRCPACGGNAPSRFWQLLLVLEQGGAARASGARVGATSG